ncbi:DNA polymerase V [Pantoea sp. SS70]|uniref:DNA polymerase V n=1 Tax=Pantoea sp. SS70 TaxID=3024247 RepID=UPI0024532DCB|nr:DNA polymerase V [Pantoea sp. SS70]WGK56142.1 DNA polymerase V [Pantoea sp. SS70]
MTRDYEIMLAFKQAMKRYASGRFTISTLDFVSELERLNWHYTLRAANRWIEMHTTTLRDISTADGDERVFQVFNPNGGM